MKSAPKPIDEKERLELLEELDILDTLQEAAYDDLTKIAATICDTPISLVSLVDEDRQWFKSRHGLDAEETPRDLAFCAHAILDDEVFYIPNSEEDERFSDNPLVTGGPNVKFYAGMPLTLKGNLRVGTLCVIDNKAKELTEDQLEALRCLGRQVVSQLELRLRIKELKNIDRMKSEFVAMVSHELRTPLTSIYGSLALLQSGAIKDQVKRDLLLKTSYNNSDRLIRIVNDILDLTKLESGSYEIIKAQSHMGDTIKKAVNALSEYLSRCEVTANIEIAENTPSALYDEDRMIQVLNNLVSNAAKFSPEGSVIDILVSAQNSDLIVEIRDHGAGIPEDKHGELFKKFSKLSVDGKGKLPGTGLGLNISKQLVELHKGTITFKSAPGKGTSFFVRLPING